MWEHLLTPIPTPHKAERINLMTEKKAEEYKILADPANPTLFIDNLFVTSRNDGMFLVRFMTALPESLKEEVRMVVPKANMEKMLDVLCNHVNHFPIPKDKAKVEKKDTPS